MTTLYTEYAIFALHLPVVAKCLIFGITSILLALVYFLFIRRIMLKWCCERLRQGSSWKGGPPWRNLLDGLKYPKYDSGKSHRAVFLWAILSLAAMVALAFFLSIFHWPSYLVDSARYLLSALAQSVAAILAVSFTVAFVTFQVASSRLTPGAAGIILRSPALHRLLAIGASTILFSLVSLIFIPTPEHLSPDARLIGLAVSAAITGVIAGFCILVLTVLFFVYALDYVRPETILEMHSRLLREQQDSLLNDRNCERVSSDTKEELLVLTELGEALIKREDRRSFSLLSRILCEAHGQVLRIWDKCLYDKGQKASAVHDITDAYTSEVFTPLIDHIDDLYDARTSEMPKKAIAKESDRFGKDWLLAVIEPLADELRGCGECENSEPLERILAILEKLSRRIPSEFDTPSLKSWGNAISLRIQKLDQLADESELGHMSALIDGLMILVRRTIGPGARDTRGLLDSIMLEVVDDDGNSAPMLKHWGCASEVAREHRQYIHSVRKVFWRALFEVFGSRPPYYFPLDRYGKIFYLEIRATPLSESFLEEVLQFVWLKRNEAPKFITSWLKLRIYLAHNLEVWPTTNCASASLLNDRLVAQIDAALEDMPKHVDLLDWTFLTGVDTGRPGYNDLSIKRVNAALDGLKKAIHPTDEA